MKKIFLSIGALTIVFGVASLFSNTAMAYQTNASDGDKVHSQKQPEITRQIIKNNDYSRWKEIMKERNKAPELINEANFAKLAKIHELMEQGKIAEAQKIRQDLGLGQQKHSMKGMYKKAMHY